ncbi:MAG: lysophospholipid acyltransferase family protein [Planctomycetota bacterium]|nr:lysophospholipid acyltransferase family protein [Planctomycetota bacterium]
MSTPGILAIALGAPLALVALWQVFVTPRLRQGPAGDTGVTFVWILLRFYARVVHRLRVEGREHLVDLKGPLVVVCNHSSPLDPFLVQSATSIFIRWMMATDQMPPDSAMLWQFSRVIPTERHQPAPRAAITAIRLLRQGGVVGVFPEGRLARPAGRVLPFHDGVGELVARTNARVLLACVQGTPVTDSIGAAFLRPSHTRLRFLGVLSWPEGTEPTAITTSLRDRIVEASGWLPVEEVQPLSPPGDPFLT